MLAFLVLFILVGNSYGCSCGLAYLQDVYCKSDFVILGQVNSITSITRMKDEFEIQVLEVFKSPDKNSTEKGKTFKAYSTGPCRADVLEKEDVIFLAVRGLRGSTPEMFQMCDVLFGETLKEMMTQFQVESLRTGYDCRCTMNQCGYNYFRGGDDVKCDQDENGDCKVVHS